MRLISAVVVLVLGANMAFAVPMVTSEITFSHMENTLLGQADDVCFAARAPPVAATNVAITDDVAAELGGAIRFETPDGAVITGKADDLVGNSTIALPAPNSEPQVTIRDRYNHHNDMRADVVDQLEDQGFRVADGEASFGNVCGVGRCRPDILYEAPDGTVGIIEIKTGNADLSIRPAEVFPQIENGDAIPRGAVADRFGLTPGIPLREQGYPNGIPIEVREFPGAGQ